MGMCNIVAETFSDERCQYHGLISWTVTKVLIFFQREYVNSLYCLCYGQVAMVSCPMDSSLLFSSPWVFFLFVCFFKWNSCLFLISKWRFKDDIKFAFRTEHLLHFCTVSLVNLEHTCTGKAMTGNVDRASHFCALLISVQTTVELESPGSGPMCVLLEECFHHQTNK